MKPLYHYISMPRTSTNVRSFLARPAWWIANPKGNNSLRSGCLTWTNEGKGKPKNTVHSCLIAIFNIYQFCLVLKHRAWARVFSENLMQCVIGLSQITEGTGSSGRVFTCVNEQENLLLVGWRDDKRDIRNQNTWPTSISKQYFK